MDSEIQSLLSEFTDIHQRVKGMVEKLGDAGVKWQPAAPETNSAAVIITHMCGSEMQWIGEYVGGRKSNRDRSKEFGQPVSDKAGLIALIDRVDAATKATLSPHSSVSLTRHAGVASRPEFKGTLRDCVLHSISHSREHVGHLELTEQLYRANR